MQAWLVSMELIWHRIRECGFGGQSQSSKRKKKGGGCPYSQNWDRRKTLSKNSEGKLILGKNTVKSRKRWPLSTLQSFWHAVGHLGPGWHGPCGTERPLQAGTGSERGGGGSWDHLGGEAADPEGSGEAETVRAISQRSRPEHLRHAGREPFSRWRAPVMNHFLAPIPQAVLTAQEASLALPTRAMNDREQQAPRGSTETQRRSQTPARPLTVPFTLVPSTEDKASCPWGTQRPPGLQDG